MSELSTPTEPEDQELLRRINASVGTELRRVGRSATGTLGGAMFIEWPDGRPAVITRFLGSLDEAHRTASVLAEARDAGLAVCTHPIPIRQRSPPQHALTRSFSNDWHQPP